MQPDRWDIVGGVFFVFAVQLADQDADLRRLEAGQGHLEIKIEVE